AAVRNSDDPVNALGSAMAKNTRLDALLSAGRFNADGLLDSNEYQDQNDAYKDTLRNAAIGRTIIQDVGSPIPYVGGFTTGAGDVYESIVASSADRPDRKSTRLNSSHVSISYAVFCLKQINS